MADESVGVTTIYDETLDECPDTVEWCIESQVLVCGTYQLLEQDQENLPGHLMKRKGSLNLYSFENNLLKKFSSLNTDAILDCKWSNSNESPVLATADAKGVARFYVLIDKNMKEIVSTTVTNEGLLLSLDWCKTTSKICTSDSNGCLSVINLNIDSSTVELRWKAHDFEAWITSYNTWDDNIIFSGGDDCKFCGWDIRTTSFPIFKNSTHQAGVCSMQCNSNKENIIATGSYDTHVRIWDTRCIRRNPLSEIDVGGGVWRIKWHPYKENIALVAGMFDGFKIVDFTNMESPKITNSFNSTEGSLAYGADWCCSKEKESNGKDIVAGCTFYDKKFCLWEIKT